MTSTSAAPRLPSASPALRSRWARLGLAGFLIFLMKGLLWLIVPALFWAR